MAYLLEQGVLISEQRQSLNTDRQTDKEKHSSYLINLWTGSDFRRNRFNLSLYYDQFSLYWNGLFFCQNVFLIGNAKSFRHPVHFNPR